jgi:uncharacterized protein
MSEITYNDIINNETVNVFIQRGNESLGALGYTEHSFVHAKRTAGLAREILLKTGFSEHEAELAAIAGYMHDIGNAVNRIDHAQSGAIMSFRILDKLGMDAEDIALIVSAIGNHDEETAFPVNPIAAALILSDKSDVRKSRVRNLKNLTSDIHDRVNYAVKESRLSVELERKAIVLTIITDTSKCPLMEYFEIFLQRMILCNKAANFIGYAFELVINGTRLL